MAQVEEKRHHKTASDAAPSEAAVEEMGQCEGKKLWITLTQFIQLTGLHGLVTEL